MLLRGIARLRKVFPVSRLANIAIIHQQRFKLSAAGGAGEAGRHSSPRAVGTEQEHRSWSKVSIGNSGMVMPDQITEKMEVVGNDGLHVGIIDGIEAREIRLAKNDAPDGLHHFLPLANVEYVDDRVHLNRSSIRAMAEWR